MPTTTRLLRGHLLRGGILAFFFTCALLKIATTLPSETATKGGGIETDDEGGFAWKVERRVLLRSGRTSRKSTPSFMSRHTHTGSSSSPLRERSWSRDKEDGGGSETADDAAEKKKKRRRRNNKKDDKKDAMKEKKAKKKTGKEEEKKKEEKKEEEKEKKTLSKKELCRLLQTSNCR